MSENFDSPIERDFCGAVQEISDLRLKQLAAAERMRSHGMMLSQGITVEETGEVARRLIAAEAKVRELEQSVEVMHIKPEGSLDGITVYWENYDPGRGMVTVVCWGSAWSCFFGAMSGDTIQSFFKTSSTSYLVGKLMSAQWQSHTKKHEKYLARVVDAVKEKLVALHAPDKAAQK